jgi:ParB-like chromosome segregation protein Spo0J
MINKQFKTMSIKDLIPYENNPRINDDAVNDVIASIEQCENLDPIEIDENNVILSGHTRLKALKKLKYKETEVLQITGLTDEQKRKYRILANKTGERAEWDLNKLEIELADLDFEGYDFDFDLPDAPFDESTLDDLFADAPEKEKKPKTAKCPHCGEVFEI